MTRPRDTCQCGQPKDKRAALCRECYTAGPQQDHVRRLGNITAERNREARRISAGLDAQTNAQTPS